MSPLPNSWSLARRASTSSPNSIEAATTFTLFPRLPIELRTAIWEFAVVVSRIVKIAITENLDLPASFASFRDVSLCCKTRLPSLVHVDHESRTVGFKHYSVALRSHLRSPIYLNFSIDTIFFKSENVFSAFYEKLDPSGDKTKIKMMVIDSDPQRNSMTVASAWRFSHFTALECLVLQFTGIHRYTQAVQTASYSFTSMMRLDVLDYPGAQQRNFKLVLVRELEMRRLAEGSHASLCWDVEGHEVDGYFGVNGFLG